MNPILEANISQFKSCEHHISLKTLHERAVDATAQ